MHLGHIVIFPIKSLDGVAVQQARITAGGILENDRIYAIMDGDGKYVNGKRVARVHDLRCSYADNFAEVRFWQTGELTPRQFSMSDIPGINQWLTEFFGQPVTLHHEARSGFPDDREAFGPTIVSDASLRAIQGWYPGLSVATLRRRFRANLELTDTEPFGEDRLFGAPGERKPFDIGDVHFFGHNPCQRCVVPTRNPDTGEPIAEFQKTFMRMRKELLPEWSNRERFNHFYRFAINTSIPETEAGKIVSVGDAVLF